MNRRDFIKNSVLTSTGILVSSNLFASGLKQREKFKIQILHTNDIHSRLERFPSNDAKNAGRGGLIYLASLVNKIRTQNQHSLLLDAGDVFQGTPYFNYFGGEPEYKLMNEMQYDVSILGNHDFDNGIAGLLQALPHKKFPILNCNYDFSESELNGKIETKPLIKSFFQNGIECKVGIIGLGIELDGLVSKKHFGAIKYLDPIFTANKLAKELKTKGCHLVIALSHLGYKYQNNKVSDLILAENSRNIDVIIGGHTHTFLSKPTIVSNQIKKPVIVNQAGWAALMLGNIELDVWVGK
jgi:5'-nucleotidase